MSIRNKIASSKSEGDGFQIDFERTSICAIEVETGILEKSLGLEEFWDLDC